MAGMLDIQCAIKSFSSLFEELISLLLWSPLVSLDWTANDQTVLPSFGGPVADLLYGILLALIHRLTASHRRLASEADASVATQRERH